MDIIEKIYQHFTKHYLVSTDSRKITPGCVFFALKGEHFDGNDYAYQVALDNIASCAVSCRKDLPYHERLFIVDDTTKALQDLARMHRERHNIPVIGITGTNGKTTTKELIASVLSQKYNIINTQGNFNNHIGVPLTLLQIKNNTETLPYYFHRDLQKHSKEQVLFLHQYIFLNLLNKDFLTQQGFFLLQQAYMSRRSHRIFP